MSNIIDSIRLSGTTYQIQGEVTVDAALDSGSTNPVANSAITTALDDKVNVVDNEVPDYNVTSQITYQGGYPSQSETASTWDDASMFTLRYNYIHISEANYTTTAAVIDPSGNITTGRTTIEETIGNPLSDYIDMSFSNNAYRFTAKEGYRIAHLDIYNDKWATWGYIREERVETVFEGGQSADVIKDVIEPALINKQDQLVSGTNIKTINNTSILGSGNIDIQGGGGKAIEAGRGISITTGETADTVSFNLPISAGTGTNSIVEGESVANGDNSHAEGNGDAEGNYSHAEGSDSIASGFSSHAEGQTTKANGISSHAEGSYTTASGNFSHVEGFGTIANNQSEHASGQYNVSSSASTTFGNSGNTLFSVGNGTTSSSRHNAFEIRQNGDIYLSSGGTDIKLQDHLGGGGSTYTAGRGISIANNAISVSLPISAGTGTNSIIEGQGTVASGNYGSHAEGWASSATSEASHAEGRETKASGYYSHAEGDSTKAYGPSSHAEGDSTSAYGSSSHAEGTWTTAGGGGAHAEGSATQALGDTSHAEGYETIANNQSEHASGQYNVSNSATTTFGNSGNTLFSVGNGTTSSSRHNAFEIRQNGDIYLTLDGQDVKLQDQLGGSSITVDTALDSGSTNPVANSAITTAIDDKQDTLVSGTNIKTINNESILGSGNIDIQGGGKAIEAGRGISITTGETADTVSFDLPISATTNGSILIGVSCSANRDKSFVGGQGSVGQGEGSFAFGQYCKAGQWSIAVGDHIEANIMPKTAAFGAFNKQNGGYYEPQSATTLFSVGNGTAGNARHNAFEIRQNGDIYLTLDGQDVKLQDQLGGGGASYSAGTGIDITNDVISVTGKADTSAVTEVSDALTAHTANTTVHTTAAEKTSWNGAATNASNAVTALGGLSLIKLTQAEYDALSPNYDSNKLYVIVN